jgi:hypothetical protein
MIRPQQQLERLFPSDPERIEAATRILEERLSAHEEVLAAFFHGSAEQRRPFRDLDVAVLLDRRRAPLREDLRYSAVLADQLSRAVALPVDVRVVNGAPPAFRDRVTRGSILTCRSPADLVRFKEKAWDDWFDFRPVAFAHLREMMR